MTTQAMQAIHKIIKTVSGIIQSGVGAKISVRVPHLMRWCVRYERGVVNEMGNALLFEALTKKRRLGMGW